MTFILRGFSKTQSGLPSVRAGLSSVTSLDFFDGLCWRKASWEPRGKALHLPLDVSSEAHLWPSRHGD